MSTQTDEYDYQRYAVLFVDDEANIRKYFRRLFSDKFRIFEAEDGTQALEVFKKHANEIGIIITDQRMPNETGVQFLSKIAPGYPDIIKILSTAYSDIDAAIGSVNEGGIFRYMTKPWDIPQLEITLRRAMEFYTIKRERDALLGAKMQAMGNVLLSSRLSAFALVPVCSKQQCNNAAQSISSFLKTCLAGKNNSQPQDSDLRTPTWSDLHCRQVALASALENQLPVALAKSSLNDRIQALTQLLGADATRGQAANSTSLSSANDSTQTFLNAILGHQDDEDQTQAAIAALAAFMAIYDAGGMIRRHRGEGLNLEITNAPESDPDTSEGAHVAKWLFDDDLLISAALGLI